jgi:signal peptidase I
MKYISNHSEIYHFLQGGFLTQNEKSRRSEKAGIFHFLREMGSALIMALIAIVYVIQAFKIPTGSMENSLLVGDFLLGLKFIYGAPVLPFSQDLGVSLRFPALSKPKAGDVIIFKYPGADKKDYIKRCVAGPGSVVEIKEKQLIVDGKELIMPPRGKYIQNGRIQFVSEFQPLKIPAKGDIYNPSTLPLREFLFFKHLVHQENSRAKITAQYQLYLNGEFSNDKSFQLYGETTTMSALHNGSMRLKDQITNQTKPFYVYNIDDWTELERYFQFIKSQFPNENPEIRNVLFKDGKPVNEYKVKFDNFFMVGDNRDNSKDSRYWGYLNYNYILAKAFILYFSWDSDIPNWQLPLKIRWNRIGKLIRSWDGFSVPKYYK